LTSSLRAVWRSRAADARLKGIDEPVAVYRIAHT